VGKEEGLVERKGDRKEVRREGRRSWNEGRERERRKEGRECLGKGGGLMRWFN
jgi:hypothetical protein